MKIILDRFQMYWAGEMRKDKPAVPTKRGAILMCGGAASFENQFTAGEIVLKGVLQDLASTCEGIITVPDTDAFPVSQNQDIRNRARDLAQLLY
jgi:hypothetical protein